VTAPTLLDLLAGQLGDVDTAWSVGTFGAIAEFSRDAGEQVILERGPDAISVVTARGGMRIRANDDLRLIASETLTAQSWNQRVALCLPEDRSAMSRRSVLSEVGPDTDALRAADRTGLLFDLGLGALQLDACIRTDDATVVTELRCWVGRPLFAPGNGAIATILAANPHRVFISRVGRVEVFQPIPPPDGKSPDGPHTHLLPRLLRHNRTHAATEALPNGWIPCGHFYPPHPTRNALGQPQRFQAERHAAFQALLGRYGDPQLVDIKRRVMESVAAGTSPDSIRIPAGRFARASVRIALRQLRMASPCSSALAT
jgi:hypothetical protein